MLPLYVLAETGSATAMSLAFTAAMAGGAVLAVVGGVCADRFDRQTVLKLSFVARAALLVAAWAAGPVGVTVALGIFARMLGQMDNPSFDSVSSPPRPATMTCSRCCRCAGSSRASR